MELYLAPVTQPLTHPFRFCQWSISHYVKGINADLSPTVSGAGHKVQVQGIYFPV